MGKLRRGWYGWEGEMLACWSVATGFRVMLLMRARLFSGIFTGTVSSRCKCCDSGSLDGG